MLTVATGPGGHLLRLLCLETSYEEVDQPHPEVEAPDHLRYGFDLLPVSGVQAVVSANAECHVGDMPASELWGICLACLQLPADTQTT